VLTINNQKIRQAAKITKAIDVKKFEILLKFKECNSQCQEMSFVQMAFNQKKHETIA
jgi:hypothetical protein